MNTHADKTHEKKSQSVYAADSQMQSGGESTFQFVDNRPEAIAQRKLQKMANNSPQVSQLRAFQEMADSHTFGQQSSQTGTADYSNAHIQRKVESDGNTIYVVAGERYDFRANLQAAMPVVANATARCHIISYASTTQSVADAFHSYIIGTFSLAQCQGHLNDLLNAVFPNGANATTHPGNAALPGIAAANHGAVVGDINGIPVKPAAGFSLVQKANLATRANNIIKNLNDSPDNLRVGDHLSNSSIQDLLDPRGGDITRNVNPANKVSYIINGTSATQIARLYDVSPGQVRFGVSKALIANSEVAGVNVGNMGLLQAGGFNVQVAPPGMAPINFICQ